MGFANQDVEQKVLAILNTLDDSPEALGSTTIAKRLRKHGIELSERSVRYHLRLMDEKGLTRLVGRREGRIISDLGKDELKKALVTHKVGMALSRIEMLAYSTSIDLDRRTGYVPVNVSFFHKDEFAKAIKIMKPVFRSGLCVSDLVAIAGEGETIGDLVVPAGKTGLATVCSIAVNGTLLKAGIPIDSKFGGILQMQSNAPLRFVELIDYAGSSLDPTEIFIKASMTSVSGVAHRGDGEILANYREIPAICRPLAQEIGGKLREAGINGVLLMGNVSESICGIPVDLNRVGVVLVGGLNPVAAAVEAGISAEIHAMSTVIDYQKLENIASI